MLTQERAKEVRHKGSQWPMCGNYRKFMTEDEIEYVMFIWNHAVSGSVTFNRIVGRVAEGMELPELQD